MLQMTIDAKEFYDEANNEFVTVESQTIELEHSLLSLSLWESKWETPFLSDAPMTYEQQIDYIRCMTLTKNVKPEVYYALSYENINEVFNYIKRKMTATTINRIQHTPKSREIVTAELIYYWMVALQIPFECQTWHLNRLLMLIEVCSIKNQPPKKMGKKAIMSRNAQINAARRQAMNTKG